MFKVEILCIYFIIYFVTIFKKLRKMRKSLCLLPLALGTFGLGLTEYVMMGILPDTAKAMNCSIPMAGNFISLYALGVVFGSILLVIIGRTCPLKKILIILASIFTIANLALVFSSNYYIFCLFRFIAGLPHGAFFGVGAIAASKLCEKGKTNQAVATMVSGMTIANLIGIPFGTFLSHNFSWRITFLIVGLFGLVVLYSIIKLIPYLKPMPDTGFRGQFRIFKSLSIWILILAVVLGNGGIFSMYSYINPLLVNVSHIDETHISIVMILAGGGMVIGNYLGGKFSDKLSPSLIASNVQLIAFLALIGMFFLSEYPVITVILMCVCTGSLFGVSAPQQVLLIKNAKGGEMLGASCSQISFNLGNALGAFVGGIPISLGFNYNYTTLPASLFVFLGCLLLFYFYRRYEFKK